MAPFFPDTVYNDDIVSTPLVKCRCAAKCVQCEEILRILAVDVGHTDYEHFTNNY